MKLNMGKVRARYFKLFKLLPPSIEKIAIENYNHFEVMKYDGFWDPKSLLEAVEISCSNITEERTALMFSETIEAIKQGWHFLPNDLPTESTIVDVALIDNKFKTTWCQQAYIEVLDNNEVSFKFDNTEIDMLDELNATPYAWRIPQANVLPKYYE